MRQTRFEQYKKTPDFDNSLYVIIGMDESGQPLVTDLCKAPQTLVAGTTGSGKSNLLHVMICSILKSDPVWNEMILIDPKHGAEFAIYDALENVHVMDNSEDAMNALEWCTRLIDARFRMFSEIGVNDLASYNSKSGKYLHPVLVVIDELADLMMTSKADTQKYIIRIGQLGRAAGVHLVVATQTPRREVVTGMIKANLPCKIAMSVSSKLESRIIIDRSGAEELKGRGDALFTKGNAPIHVQVPYISRQENQNVISEAMRVRAHSARVEPEMKIASLAQRRSERYANESRAEADFAREQNEYYASMAAKNVREQKYRYAEDKLEEAKMRMFWWRL